VRITTVQDIANVTVTPWLGEFMNLYPDIRVEVIATERCLDLNSGEADIAIRAGSETDGIRSDRPQAGRGPMADLLQQRLRRKARRRPHAPRTSTPT
jgi:DNA-binding transcriptional LysR family regulator